MAGNMGAERWVIGPAGLQSIITRLAREGREVIGPRVRDGAVIYAPIANLDDLPIGVRDEQDGGHYRLLPSKRAAFFDHVVGPHSWKRYLYPPEECLFRARKTGQGFRLEANDSEPQPRLAFIGVRACELAAMAIQDRVFDNGQFASPSYLARRRGLFVVAVNCGRPGNTCFCGSMNTGPEVRDGHDVVLTELVAPGRHDFLAGAGSAAGLELLRAVVKESGGRPAAAADLRAARRRLRKAAAGMGREMIADAAAVVAARPEHRRWRELAERCLACANCTMVCPTCFCSTTEDLLSLDGLGAERRRAWDSCFTIDFSYLHGGSIRRSGGARYRQWITHKLSSWHQQFGTSGCTGCGRCITWCPVGIDITEEARALRDAK